MSLVAKCLLNSQSKVWIENPSNSNVQQIFSYYTQQITPIEVDNQGLQPALFPTGEKPTLIFTTPSHQFPMGGILPMQRRIELVQFARKSGAYILEDDYDSEFTYDSPPSKSLFELDSERVIYVGTFSKIMFPSIRLGYLIVPLCLVSKMRELKRLADHHSNSAYQLALLRFIESGDLERHIRRMKKVYRSRRDCLLELLHSCFGERVRIFGTAAGMHVIAEFKDLTFTAERAKGLLRSGVYVVSVENHSIEKGIHNNQIILGYAGLEREAMSLGIDLLKAQFREVL